MNVTIVELPEFIRRSDNLLTSDERDALVFYLSMHPQAGRIVRGSGGIRKLRWAKGNKGKSGGVRVIYFYHDPRMPLFLLTLFSKSERENLTKADMNGLRQMVDVLITN